MDRYQAAMARNEIEKQQYRYQLLIRSLEAKVERIEPNSVEFDNTLAAIFDAKTKIAELNQQQWLLGYEELASVNTNA